MQATEQIYDPATVNLRDAIGHLISRTRQKLLDAVDLELEGLDMTYAQALIVIFLANHMSTKPVEFCRTLQYDPAGMTRLLDRLEKKGFICRKSCPEDRRSVDIVLTEEGRELYPKLVPLMVNAYHRLLHGLTKAEVNQLEDLLRKVLANP